MLMRYFRIKMSKINNNVILFGVIFGCLVFIFWTLKNISSLHDANSKLEFALKKLQAEGTSYNGAHNKEKLMLEKEEVDSEDIEMKTKAKELKENDDIVMIYNRVPKTGSTSFAGVAYALCKKNKYNVLHLNITKNSHVMSWADQAKLVTNITTWNTKKPALYHGHVAYIEFSSFSVKRKPIYINIIRDPLQRLISYYYFMRYGDNFRPYLKRRKAGDTQTFDECVANEMKECSPQNLWLQVPFMCGQAAECWNPGSKWALEQAKFNLVNNYLLVGLTEQLDQFVTVLEAIVPRFFKGATKLFKSGNKSHLRKTIKKKPPSEETVAKIRESPIWQIENEFYEFARKQFNHIVQKTFLYTDDGEMILRKKQFMYEKIRPR